MRGRIKSMRRGLHAALRDGMPERCFDYLRTQRGMFSYTGFSPSEVDRLRDEHGIYLVRSGRICIAGQSSRSIERVAQAFISVLARRNICSA